MNVIKALLPSAISGSRLLLAALFPFCNENFWFWIILAAGASDALDGMLARNWNVQSWQGALIDGIADKVFVLTVLVVLALAGKYSVLWLPLVLARDLLVLVSVVYAVFCRFWGAFSQIKTRISGKVATGGQYALFLVIVLFPSFTDYALIFCAVGSVIAAIDYGRLYRVEYAGWLAKIQH